MLAPDHIVGAIVDLDVGSKAAVLHRPLAIQVVAGEFGTSDVTAVD
jgi:hypothetical protein